MIRSATPYITSASRTHYSGLGATIAFLAVAFALLAIALAIA